MQFENTSYDNMPAILIFGSAICLMALVLIVTSLVEHKIPRLGNSAEKFFFISLPVLVLVTFAAIIPMSIHQKGEVKQAYASNIEKKYSVENVEFTGYGKIDRGEDENYFKTVKLTVDGEDYDMLVDVNEETSEPTLENIPFAEKEDHLDIDSLLRK